MDKIRGSRAAAKYLSTSKFTIFRLVNAGLLKPIETNQISENIKQDVYSSDDLDAVKSHVKPVGRPRKPATES